MPEASAPKAPTRDQEEWMALAYASLLMGEDWQIILATLFRDIERYLAFVEIARS